MDARKVEQNIGKYIVYKHFLFGDNTRVIGFIVGVLGNNYDDNLVYKILIHNHKHLNPNEDPYIWNTDTNSRDIIFLDKKWI